MLNTLEAKVHQKAKEMEWDWERGWVATGNEIHACPNKSRLCYYFMSIFHNVLK